MCGYRVRLFKYLVNSQGKSFKTLQGNFEVPDANSAAEAESIAFRQFEQWRKVPNWHLLADSVETEACERRASRR